jgi:hypothetical protein
MTSIALFYPSRTMGGAERTLQGFAETLTALGHQITYIDYEDGHVARNLAGRADIRVLTLESAQERPLDLSDVEYFVKTLTSPALLPPMTLSPTAKGTYYALHAYNPLWLMPDIVNLAEYPLDAQSVRRKAEAALPRSFGLMRELIAEVGRQQGILGYSHINRLFMESFFGYETPRPELGACTPISFPPDNPLPELLSWRKAREADQLSLGWVGRMDRDKRYTLDYLMGNLMQYACQHPELTLSLHLIGDGDYREKLAALQSQSPGNLSLIFTGTLTGRERDFYLKHQVDLGVGLGMSPMEFAKLAIPAVQLTSRMDAMPLSDRMHWMHEMPFEQLCEHQQPEIEAKGRPFAEFLDTVLHEPDAAVRLGEAARSVMSAMPTAEAMARHFLACVTASQAPLQGFVTHDVMAIKDRLFKEYVAGKAP